MAAVKRKLQAAAGAWPCGAKRIKGPEQPRTLLNLPAEIRTQILKELLTTDEPMFYDADKSQPLPQLWPEVLRTCKQMEEEGKPLLYSNEVGIRIGFPRPDGDLPWQDAAHCTGRWSHKDVASAYIMGHNLRLMDDEIADRFSRISIYIRLGGETSMDSLRQGLEHVLSIMSYDPSVWSCIGVVFDGEDCVVDDRLWKYYTGLDPTDEESEESRHLSSYVLQPLLRVRGRELGRCVGVTDSMADKIRRHMRMSGPVHGPVRRLEAMLDDLLLYCMRLIANNGPEDYTDWVVDDPYNNARVDLPAMIERRLWRGCRGSNVCEDPVRFFRQRRIVLDMVRLLNVDSQLGKWDISIYCSDENEHDPHRLTLGDILGPEWDDRRFDTELNKLIDEPYT
jgi:hypothetical protein